MRITPPPSIIPYSGNRETHTKNYFLLPVLHGIGATFTRALNHGSPIEFSFTDALKEVLKLRDKVVYPRHFLRLTSIDRKTEEIGNTAMYRRGLPIGHQNHGGEGIKNAHIFPIEINFELHTIDSDSERLIHHLESLFLVGGTTNLTFSIDTPVKHDIAISLKSDSIDLDIMDLEGGPDFAATALKFDYSARTWAGYVSDVPQVHDIRTNDPVVVNSEIDGHNKEVF